MRRGCGEGPPRGRRRRLGPHVLELGDNTAPRGLLPAMDYRIRPVGLGLQVREEAVGEQGAGRRAEQEAAVGGNRQRGQGVLECHVRPAPALVQLAEGKQRGRQQGARLPAGGDGFYSSNLVVVEDVGAEVQEAVGGAGELRPRGLLLHIARVGEVFVPGGGAPGDQSLAPGVAG